jgi:hypothetical protein
MCNVQPVSDRWYEFVDKPSASRGGPRNRADEKMRRLARKQVMAARRIKESPRGLVKWVGKLVKKVFPCGNNPLVSGESMWVKVVRVENGRLVGRLDNDPVCCDNLRHNDMVSLGESEIIAVCVD